MKKRLSCKLPILPICTLYIILISLIEMKVAWNPIPLFCKLDFIISVLWPLRFIFIFFLPIVFTFLFSFSNSFNVYRLYRFQSRKSIWIKQEKRCLGYSIIFATVFMVTVTICFPDIKLYNWNMHNSMFNLMTAKTLDYPISFILLLIYICIILELFLIQSILLFSFWWKNTCTYGFILACLIKISEVDSLFGGIILKRIVIGYDIWTNPGQQIMRVAYIGVFALIMGILYRLFVVKKEFLRE